MAEHGVPEDAAQSGAASPRRRFCEGAPEPRKRRFSEAPPEEEGDGAGGRPREERAAAPPRGGKRKFVEFVPGPEDDTAAPVTSRCRRVSCGVPRGRRRAAGAGGAGAEARVRRAGPAGCGEASRSGVFSRWGASAPAPAGACVQRPATRYAHAGAALCARTSCPGAPLPAWAARAATGLDPRRVHGCAPTRPSLDRLLPLSAADSRETAPLRARLALHTGLCLMSPRGQVLYPLGLLTKCALSCPPRAGHARQPRAPCTPLTCSARSFERIGRRRPGARCRVSFSPGRLRRRRRRRALALPGRKCSKFLRAWSSPATRKTALPAAARPSHKLCCRCGPVHQYRDFFRACAACAAPPLAVV